MIPPQNFTPRLHSVKVRSQYTIFSLRFFLSTKIILRREKSRKWNWNSVPKSG